VEPKQALENAGEAAGVGAAIVYGLSLIFSKRHKAAHEVSEEVNTESNRLIELLKEQRDFLEGKIDCLGDEVKTLTATVERYACPNAPTCENRPDFADGMLHALNP
jgi:hypothetical protein